MFYFQTTKCLSDFFQPRRLAIITAHRDGCPSLYSLKKRFASDFQVLAQLFLPTATKFPPTSFGNPAGFTFLENIAAAL